MQSYRISKHNVAYLRDLDQFGGAKLAGDAASRYAVHVARSKDKLSVQRRDPAEALAKLEKPKINWKVLAQIGAGVATIWVIAAMLVPYVGFWSLGVVGVLTLVLIGFGLYIWRMSRKSSAIVDILKSATDKEGRAAALEQLRAQNSGEAKDALNALAQSQLVAQDSPSEAIKILEGVNLEKAPTLVQDDIRANLALLYLVHGRARDARKLADEIRLDRQSQPKAKAMYAGVVAEAFARTGKAGEARTLLETYDANDPSYEDVRAILLRAQVHTFMATKKRNRARQAMEQLVQVDPNMVASFVQKGNRPEVSQMARHVLLQAGVLPKQKVRMTR